MKILILSISMMLLTIIAKAQMDIPPDGGNIKASITEDVGITSITIQYCRPGVKGREGKIWGNVVAYGFGVFNFNTFSPTSPWRAGANEATLITFEHDVKVEGKNLQAGTYALFLAMGIDTVTVIFSNQVGAWGSFYYRPEDDVLRVKVVPVSLDKTVEWLKYEFIEHTDTSCVIAMQWEKLSVPFRVDVEVDDIVFNTVKKQMITSKGFLSGNLVQVSRYFFRKGTHLEEALAWAERSVTGKPFGQTSFDNYRSLAIGYEKLNRQQAADSVMNMAIAVASMNQYVSYGLSLIEQNRNQRAVETMLAAKEKFGDAFAINNTLMLAYTNLGDKKKALEYGNKALTQAPSPQKKEAVMVNIEKLKK